MSKPGDFYEFTIDVVNNGTIDAMIDSVTKTPELSETQAKYFKYIVEYQNGEAITTKQLVEKKSFVRLKVRVEFRSDITASDIPQTGETLSLSFKVNYVQADSSGTNVGNDGLLESVLKGKTAIFLGDSVAYGYHTGGNGFGYYVDSIVDLADYTNAAVSSATLNTSTQSTNNVINQINSYKGNSYDYVILQGGFGDLRDKPTLGNITEGYDVRNLDTTTFAGAVEYTLYLTTTYWNNAKIGYIISYYSPRSNQGVRPDFNKSKEYWDVVKAACNKWNVSYLDLFEGSTMYNGEVKSYTELLDVYNANYISVDGVHPTAEGYEFMAPFIAEWMQGLKSYSASFEVIKDFVMSFSDLIFYKDSAISTASSTVVQWGSSSVGRASAVNQYVKVNGGEKIGLIDGVNVSFAIWELDINKNVTNLGYMHNSWLNDDIILHEDTEYIVVSFKNGDGSTSFTDDQLSQLGRCIKFK